jgi:hypothetical protein
MSRTIRRDKLDRKYSFKLKDYSGYRCRCFFCTGKDRKDLKEKIMKKELNIAVNSLP